MPRSIFSDHRPSLSARTVASGVPFKDRRMDAPGAPDPVA
jgi:hypothetical protein